MICWPYWIGETKKVTSLVRRLGSYWIILNLKKYCIGRSTLHGNQFHVWSRVSWGTLKRKLSSVHMKFSRELCKAWLQGVFKDSLLAFTSWLFSPELGAIGDEQVDRFHQYIRTMYDDDDDIFVYLSSRKTHRFTTYIHKEYYKEKKGIILAEVFKEMESCHDRRLMLLLHLASMQILWTLYLIKRLIQFKICLMVHKHCTQMNPLSPLFSHLSCQEIIIIIIFIL